MNCLSQLIRDDMKPALGVTEPGAIAFAAAKARSYTTGPVETVEVAMNSGMYKNAFTCGIPNSNEIGNVFAAALGVVAGNSDKGLEALANVTLADNEAARKLVDQGCTMKGIVAVDAAFKSVELAMHNVYIFPAHGINGKTPELTMKHMGLIASPGMVETEKTIVDILENK